MFRYFTTRTTFRQYCVFRAWFWVRRLYISVFYFVYFVLLFYFVCFVFLLVPLLFMFLLTTITFSCSSCFTCPLMTCFFYCRDCRESIPTQWEAKSFISFFFFKVLFLLICWTLRGECTFRSDQCPSNSYLKESHRKPWNSYKNLDCLLFIRFTRTLVFGYQALFKPPTVLSLLAFNSRGKHWLKFASCYQSVVQTG